MAERVALREISNEEGRKLLSIVQFTVAEHQAIRKIALGRPTDHGEPFATWSLTKLADHVVREGVVEDISHEGTPGAPPRRVPPFKR